ncbi:MAG: hypothetical protein EXR69_11220 [Myxococcales bacterium]|nr:hypothetical protein [Myxococcales bacterium]
MVLEGSCAGTEVWSLTADGVELCRVEYQLASQSARADCADCAWAVDLQIGGATMVAESDPGCAGTLGDAATMDGTTLSYGYSPE